MPGGEALRERIDDMANEEYQVLIRRPGAERASDSSRAHRRRAATRWPEPWPTSRTTTCPSCSADLGGHDQAELERALREADAERDRPTVVFAYTIKGWRLPFAGDSLNHSALLAAEQVEALARPLGADPDDPWAAFAGRLAGGAPVRAGVERELGYGSPRDPDRPGGGTVDCAARRPDRGDDQHPAGVRRHAGGARARPGGRRRGS